jgi:hypothetical protein
MCVVTGELGCNIIAILLGSFSGQVPILETKRFHFICQSNALADEMLQVLATQQFSAGGGMRVPMCA